MKASLTSLLLLGIIFFSQYIFGKTQFIAKQRLNLNLQQTDVIYPGHGYSTDRQQTSPIKCYNVQVLPITSSSSDIKFDSGMSYTDIQKSLHINVDAKGQIGMWKAGIQTDYLKQSRDTDYSFSMSYYHNIQAVVVMQIGYGEASALTKDGYAVYQGGKNPDFGIICGDKFIKEFTTGATLVLGMKVQFHNHEDKEKFLLHAGVSFGSLASISTQIQRTAQSSQVSGSVTVQGYQVGGNPSQLSKFLNQKCGQHYCSTSCSIQNTADCQKTVDGLLRYAHQEFTNQVSVKENIGLNPFSVGYATLLDIKWVGLKTPQSYVDDTVQESRVKLANSLLENKYYTDKFHILLEKYPVSWDKNSNLYNKILNASKIIDNNINILSNHEKGAIICYDDPQNCNKNSELILKKIISLTPESLQFLNDIKYYISFPAVAFKMSDSNSSYQAIPQVGVDYLSATFELNKNKYCFNLVERFQNLSSCSIFAFYTQAGCLSSNDGLIYSGCYLAQNQCYQPLRTCDNLHTVSQSPYYFNPYIANNNNEQILSINKKIQKRIRQQ